MSRAFVRCSAAALATGLLVCASAPAATIAWSGLSPIVGDSDVITTGSLVMAYNFSQTQLPVTVNGVPFSQFAIPNGANAIVGFSGIATIGIFNLESSDTSYGSAAAPFSGLSASYQTLLGSGMGSSSGATLTLNLGGLSNGSSYIFQVWCNDSDLVHGGVPMGVVGGAASTGMIPNLAGPGGTGTWVSGTFTATGTGQAIDFSGSRPVINAFQFREVPAPGAAGLLGLGGLMTARRRRR